MYLMLAPPDSKGIYVRTTPSLHLPDEYCLAGPIVLSLRKNGASTRTYLNGAEIKPEQLARALRAQLAARANWEVFVEGDDSLDFAESMNTIALITDLHTKTVLLTPQLKRELASQCSSR
jgi:biopolymer transport protein ExbD